MNMYLYDWVHGVPSAPGWEFVMLITVIPIIAFSVDFSNEPEFILNSAERVKRETLVLLVFSLIVQMRISKVI